MGVLVRGLGKGADFRRCSRLAGSTLCDRLGGEYRVLASCEIKQQKRDWILAGTEDGNDACCFTDVCTLADPRASNCVRHKNCACTLQKLKGKHILALCGWSCKDLSTCNGSAKGVKDQVPRCHHTSIVLQKSSTCDPLSSQPNSPRLSSYVGCLA